jgi:WD40 repeat protein/transcriptional regulator with XRE-family HTH domain
MKRSSISEPDDAFGQVMLTLRTTLGLTQAELAKCLGISRHAVGDWERGFSYPKAQHLKHFIQLAIKRQVFQGGGEAEEILALWNAAHQKEFLDEQWLQAQLTTQPPPLKLVMPPHFEETSTSDHMVAPPTPGPRVDWGEALALPTFYGRKPEQELLSRWIVQEHCRVVSILGMGGIGKSALSVSLMHQVARHFEVVIFRPLRDTPSCEELLENCLQVLIPESLALLPSGLHRRLNLLQEQLRTSRVLLVLDNMESLLEDGDPNGHLRPGFEAYGQLLRQVAQTEHQSCLLLTSREKTAELRGLEGSGTPVRSLRLQGLDMAAGKQLLSEHGIEDASEDCDRLVQAYEGNPLALKIVAEIITDLFGGEISQFLLENTAIFGSIAELLDEQWGRLSPFEQTVLYWQAIMREPVTLEDLRSVLVPKFARMQVLEAVNGLHRRSLIERGKRTGSFTLQSVVLEFVTSKLVTTVSEEIKQGEMERILQHGLSQAQAKEYIRQTQERLLLVPLLALVQKKFREQTGVEKQLCDLLDALRAWTQEAQGYGPANLIALLRLQCGHLRGLDLSYLTIRNAYLQGVEMQDTSLTESTLYDTVFTEALHATWAVAISQTGQFWAAGNWRGEVRVWHEEGQRLHMVWKAHTENTFTLAFSPDERTLASGSWDGTVKLWDLQSGDLLWTGLHTDIVLSVAFSPDGSMLASSGNDAIAQIWDVSTGHHIQTLMSQGGGIYAVAWSPDGQLLANGCCDGSIQLWQVQERQPATRTLMLADHSSWVHSLAFSPDGTRLVSSSWDSTVKIWDVTRGCVIQTLTGHKERVYSVAWSRDGRTIASASFDKTIWLWDVEQSSYRAVLQGHTSAVYNLAFMPDSCQLLSGSEDSTLRMWDVNHGQCLRCIEGYAVSFYDIDWSPDGTHLASGSTDGQVIIWEVASKAPSRVLQAHQWIVMGVAWSPDGQLLVSSGWDGAIRLWETKTGTCVRELRNPDYKDTLFHAVAWHPNGRLLASGSYLQGVHVWDMIAHSRFWVGRPSETAFLRVAWSSDGTRLASGGDDGSVCTWDTATGTLLLRLSGHQGLVKNVAFSPDGTMLASAGGGKSHGELFVWDAQRGERLREFVGHPGMVYAVAWDLSGKLLVSGCSDGMLRWLDVGSGECLKRQAAHQGAIQSLKRSPDGRQLASCGDDGAIMIWDLDSGKHLQTLRRDRPYERLNITEIRGLTQAQKATLHTLGAVDDAAITIARAVPRSYR